MRIQEIMSDKVHTVGPGADAESAWQMMRTHAVRHLIVVEDRRVLGVLSDSDAGGRFGAAIRSGATVRDLMDTHVVSVVRTDTVRKAANVMKSHLITCVPVIERGRLVGVVTATNLLTTLGGGADRPAHNARAAIHHRVAHRKARAATGRW